TKAIEMLEAEGSAVAFPEVFKQVREDMKHVQRRLGVIDTGVVTQAIEKDIIDTLKEMIEALKKARQELDNQKNPPSNSPPPPPQDQKLLDQIAELKMIRSMQIRVNSRTEIYGKQYNGEQAGEPAIVRELRNLSERQERIFEVTNRIAKGDNKCSTCFPRWPWASSSSEAARRWSATTKIGLSPLVPLKAPLRRQQDPRLRP